MSRRVLVVEDDREFADLLALWLHRAGLDARTALGGADALRAVYDWRPELVSLDIGLPQMDGWELCTRIRELSSVPILFVSALGSEADRVRGLRLGGDDYITKPFSFREYVARVEAALRRAALAADRPGHEVFRHRDLVVDVDGHRVLLGGAEIHLTPTEFRLLVSLARHGGALVSHGQLLHDAWGPDYRDELPLLRSAIRGLRARLADASAGDDYIGTEYGFGYRLGGMEVRAGG
ncbi:MAG TPA: response regulator transcription factor [Candidatus Limnocylindria bacterium]